MVRSAPLGDPLEVTVRGLHLSLRRSEAARIHVANR
jgi:Fe2+ transport system protein FeoA